MASDKLQRILEMSKNMDKKGKKGDNIPKTPIKPSISLTEQINSANKQISNIDKIYNAPYIPTKQEKETWNRERGREELTEISDNSVFMEKLNKSHLPKAILESMRKNPCNYTPDMINKAMGPENEFFKKLNEKFGKGDNTPKSGVEAVQKINEQLEAKDKKDNTENASNNNGIDGFSINDNELKKVIEEIFDKKINELKNTIQNGDVSNIRTMAITDGGSFRFLDSEDNVYECQMKYLGKRKKTKSK